jgi:hypothetical protein
MAVSTKMAVFRVVAPCSLVEVSNISEVLAAITLMMEAVSTSDTSVNFYQTAQCNNPEDSHLRIHTCFTVPASTRIISQT